MVFNGIAKPFLGNGVTVSVRYFFHGNPIPAQKNVLANGKTRTDTV